MRLLRMPLKLKQTRPSSIPLLVVSRSLSVRWRRKKLRRNVSLRRRESLLTRLKLTELQSTKRLESFS